MITKREWAAIERECLCPTQAMTWRGRSESPGRFAAAVYRAPDLTPDERRTLKAFLEIELSTLQGDAPAITEEQAAAHV